MVSPPSANGRPSEPGAQVNAMETAVLAQIRAFKNPNETWLQNLADFVDYPLDVAGDFLFNNPIGDRVEPAVVRVMSVLNGAAASSVRHQAIFGRFREHGFSVDAVDDVAGLNIDGINETIGHLAAKYQSLGAMAGASASVLGVAGVTADIPALVTLALRAINEYATYFGFDSKQDDERWYVLMVLAAASSVTDAGRQRALSEITRIGREMSAMQHADVIDKRLTGNLVKRVAQALVVRLTKGRIARVVPGLGPVIGGGYNTLFLAEVCKTAYMLYAERWLMRKHGASVAAEVLASF